MSVRQSLFDYLDARPGGPISGWELFEDMARRTGRKTYPATLLQYAREYAELSGASFDVVDHERSIYHFIPGAKIAGSIFD